MLRFASLLSLLMAVSLSQAQPANDYPDCVKGKLAGTPICDMTLTPTIRASHLIGLMNVTEKAKRLQNTAPAIDRIGLPAYQWWSEALHGVAGSPGVNFAPVGQPFSCATSFPEPIGLGASFDREMIQRISETTSDEARAFNNAGRAGLDFWTPNINCFRDPRWGRGQETPGEDTYLSSEYVYYLINGYQNGEDPKYYKIVADCKHYAGYDLEHWNGVDRYSYNAIISEQDLVETYLPSFKSCLKDAKVGSAMCSYNAINGVPACANDMLMNQVAREKWNWEGWITSDCGAISGIFDGHHYVSNHSSQVQVALRGGCDIGCDSALSDYSEAAVKDGSINESDLDKALMRTFVSLIRLGYFDSPINQPYRKYGIEKVATDRATALSLRAARESLVLLKNDGLLPLSTNQDKNDRLIDRLTVNSIALIGPNADAGQSQIGNYAGAACFMQTPKKSFNDLSGLTINYAQGCEINSTSSTGFSDAINAAKMSDVIVFVGGLNQSIEAEGLDRYTIDLPGEQSALIRQLTALQKPLIVVLMNGGGVDVSKEVANPGVNAIIWAGYPSQSGGDAIVDLIMGKYSPSGRLPVTWYPSEYVNLVPLTDQSMRPNQQTGNPGRTYKFYQGQPVFPFGFGLSYSTFNYQTVNQPIKKLHIADLAAQHANKFDERSVQATTWTVNITNSGPVDSDLVVLAFVSSSASFEGITPPIKELYDYTHIHSLASGASEVFTFGLGYRVFSSIDSNGHAWLLPGRYQLALQHDSVLVEEFDLIGEPLLIEESPVSDVKPVYPITNKMASE